MTAEEQKLSRTASVQEQKINILRDRLDALAPGESSRFGPSPADDVPLAPAEGPDAAIPRSGPHDLPESGLKKVIEKQDALIKAYQARIKELEKKKS